MSETMYVFFKRNDQPGGVLDGMPVCYADPDEWLEHCGISLVIPEFMKVAFLPVIMKKSEFKALIKNALSPLNLNDDSKPKRSAYVDFAEMETVLKIPGLAADARLGGKIESLDGSKLTPGIFKTTEGIKPLDLKDIHAWSSGAKTIGSGGTYDYLIPSAASADINLTGNATGTLMTNVTDNAVANFIPLNTNTLTMENNSPQYGNPTTGNVMSVNHANSGFAFVDATGGTINLNNWMLKMVAAQAANQALIRHGTTVVNGTMNVKNVILDGNSQSQSNIRVVANTSIFKGHNIKSRGALVAGAIFVTSINAGTLFENCVFASNAIGISNANLASTVRNCVFAANTNNYINNVGSTSVNCATDAVGVGAATNNSPQNGIVLATNFISTNIASANHFKVLSGGVCDNNGAATTIAGNTTGERRNARPNTAGSVSIGADQIGDIAVTNPAGGSSFKIGDTIMIRWASHNLNGNVTIELSRDGGVTWETIFPTTPDDGVEPWVVTAPITNNAVFRVTDVTDTGLTGTMATRFNVLAAPTKITGTSRLSMAIGLGL